MIKHKEWKIPEQTLYIISTLPVEQQRDFYKEKYELTMTTLQAVLEKETGKLLLKPQETI